MLFPQTPRPTTPHTFRNIRPFVSGGPVWATQDRSLTVFGLYAADLLYAGRVANDIVLLWDFFEQVGAAGRFTFVDFNGVGVVGGSDPGLSWRNLFVAQGDGGTTSWDLPSYALRTSLTTVVASLASGARTVTPASMTGIAVGQTLTAMNADGSNPEIISVTAKTPTTFTAVFASAKAGNWLVQAPLVLKNGAVQTTFITGSPGPGTFGVILGAGTDGRDQLKAGTAPAAGDVLTFYGQCRRAMIARFIADTNPFVINTAGSYAQTTAVTIQEVRK